MLPCFAFVPFGVLQSFLAVMLRHNMGTDAFEGFLPRSLGRRLGVAMDPKQGRPATRITRLARFARLRYSISAYILTIALGTMSYVLTNGFIDEGEHMRIVMACWRCRRRVRRQGRGRSVARV